MFPDVCGAVGPGGSGAVPPGSSPPPETAAGGRAGPGESPGMRTPLTGHKQDLAQPALN